MNNEENRKKNKKYKRRAYNLDGMPTSDLKMNYFKKKRQQKRIKTKIFQAHSFLKFVAIIAMLWISSRIMICKFWYLPQNIFDTYPNKHMRIIGNKITSNEKIINALKIHPIPKVPIYLLNTAPYEKEIEKLSPIKKAFVRRYWLPTRFEVTVEEEIPVLTIAPSPTSPEIAALTLNGKVISRDYLPIDNTKQKTYKILTYDEFKNWTKDEIFHLNVLAQRIEDFSGERLIYLDIRNKNDVFAQLETIKIRIGELNSTLKERIERLSSIMPQIADLKHQTDYVDIRWDNTTYLKKRAKNAPFTEPQLTNPPEQINNEETREKQSDKSQETKAQTTVNAHKEEQDKSIPTKKVENKTELKQTQVIKNEPKKNISIQQTEPQPLPDINIQIVEP